MREPVAVVFVSSLTPPPPPKTTLLENLQAQPHRIFFFAGIVQGLVYALVLALNYLGVLSLSIGVGHYHAYAFTFNVFTQFFAGFLLTTFPRYLARPTVSKTLYMPIIWFINGGSFLFLALSLFSQTWVILGMAVGLVGYVKLCFLLLELQTKSTVTNKTDTSWMLRAFAMGLVGYGLFIANLFLPLSTLAIMVSFYLYLLMIVLIVSQKMIPFFTANAIAGYTVSKSRYFLHVILFFLILKIVLEYLNINALAANGGLFLTVTYELIKWRLPFKKAPAILSVLFLSLWWMPISFGLFSLHDISMLLEKPIYMEKAALHALALGYFTTILIGFGTRIILGHAGRTPKADGYATLLFGLIQVMTLMRLFAGIFPEFGYLHAILTVIALWIIIFGMWSKRYIHILFEK